MRSIRQTVASIVVLLATLMAACAPASPPPAATSAPSAPTSAPPAAAPTSAAKPTSAAPAPAAATAAPAAAKPTAASGLRQFSPALQALIDAANKEGKVVIGDTGPADVIANLAKAFNQRFGTNIDVELVPVRAVEVAPRLQQESAAGKITIDVVHPSSSLVYGLIKQNADVFETYDWVGTFGTDLPQINESAGRVPDNLKGKVLDYQHLIRVIAYNTKLAKPEDLPTTWEGLLDPKWKDGKIAIDPQGSSTYQLETEWDDQTVMDFSRKLAAQNPVWVSSEPGIAQAVAKGDAVLGITSPANIKDQLDLGLPIGIGHVEFAPGQQQLVFPVKGSPHANAARLFAGWWATEGIGIMGKLGKTTERAWPDSNSWMSQELKSLGIKVDILVDQADVERADNLRVKIASEYRQLGAGGGGAQ